ncbi:MAG TPA: EamA family transporter [Microthrixaceae bacterium]|nr:EamA family transporter [Microthrixaceae bacterium]
MRVAGPCHRTAVTDPGAEPLRATARTATARTPALVAVAVAAALFGTSGVARGLGPDGLSSMFVASWRTVVGGAGLIAFTTLRRDRPWAAPLRVGWTLLGGVAVVGYQAAFFAAADRVGVGSAAVVTIATGPAVAGVIDRLAFDRRVSKRWLLGVCVAVPGVVALASGSGGEADPTGWAFAVLAGVCYPTYGFATQQLVMDRSPTSAIATVFGAGALLALPFAIGSSVAVQDSIRAAPWGTAALVMYLGLASTALAYGLWAIGLRHLSLSDTVAVTLAEPVAAVVLAAILLDEALSARSAAAMTVIVGSVYVATARGDR